MRSLLDRLLNKTTKLLVIASILLLSNSLYAGHHEAGEKMDQAKKNLLHANNKIIRLAEVSNKEAKKPILFCHGNAGNISDRLETNRLIHEMGFNTLF